MSALLFHMVSGAPDPAALRNLSSSARQSWRAVETCVPRQPRRTASASSGIVSSHEQIKMFRGRSAILRPGCRALPAEPFAVALAMTQIKL